jgi:hypothetical protein
MSTVTIPAQLSPVAREGAVCMLGEAAADIKSLAQRRETCSHLELLAEPLARLDTMRGLVDALDPFTINEDATIDGGHMPALRDALQEYADDNAEVPRAGQPVALRRFLAELGGGAS